MLKVVKVRCSRWSTRDGQMAKVRGSSWSNGQDGQGRMVKDKVRQSRSNGKDGQIGQGRQMVKVVKVVMLRWWGWSRIRWPRWSRSRWSGSDRQGGQGQTIKAVKVKVKMGKVVEVVKLNEARWSRGSRWSRSDGQGHGSGQMVKIGVHVR